MDGRYKDFDSIKTKIFKDKTNGLTALINLIVHTELSKSNLDIINNEMKKILYIISNLIRESSIFLQ